MSLTGRSIDFSAERAALIAAQNAVQTGPLAHEATWRESSRWRRMIDLIRIQGDGLDVKHTKWINSCVRQIAHDNLGWCAIKKGRRNVLGHCAGTLYRSEKFMSIPIDIRVGNGKQRNIHIEHTIPAVQLIRLMVGKIKKDPNVKATEIMKFIIERSVVAALSKEEQSAMKGCVDPKNNDCLEYPFRRYLGLKERLARQGKTFNLYEIVSGEPINLESFSLQSHMSMVNEWSWLWDVCGRDFDSA